MPSPPVPIGVPPGRPQSASHLVHPEVQDPHEPPLSPSALSLFGNTACPALSGCLTGPPVPPHPHRPTATISPPAPRAFRAHCGDGRAGGAGAGRRSGGQALPSVGAPAPAQTVPWTPAPRREAEDDGSVRAGGCNVNAAHWAAQRPQWGASGWGSGAGPARGAGCCLLTGSPQGRGAWGLSGARCDVTNLTHSRGLQPGADLSHGFCS